MSVAPEGYDVVARSLSHIASMAPRIAVDLPLLTRAEVCCAVDERCRVHVIRLAPRAEESDDPRAIEAAILSPDGGEPRFSPISPPLHRPLFPVMARLGDAYVVGVVGSPARSEEVDLRQTYQVLLTHTGAGPSDMPSPALGPTRGAARLAAGPDGVVHVLAPRWCPPWSITAAVALRLASFVKGRGTLIADPIRSTGVPGSCPRDAALHASSDGRIHLVYDGLRGIPRSPTRLYHVVLDASGEVVDATDLAPAPHNTILSAIVPAPDGRLFYLNVSLAEEGSPRLDHRLLCLDAIDAPGAKERYFVDCWLRPHAVWFDGDGAQCAGPTSAPALSS